MRPGDIALVMCIYEPMEGEKEYRLRTVDTKTIIIASEDEIYLPRAKTDAEKFADYMNERNKGNR